LKEKTTGEMAKPSSPLKSLLKLETRLLAVECRYL